MPFTGSACPVLPSLVLPSPLPPASHRTIRDSSPALSPPFASLAVSVMGWPRPWERNDTWQRSDTGKREWGMETP